MLGFTLMGSGLFLLVFVLYGFGRHLFLGG